MQNTGEPDGMGTIEAGKTGFWFGWYLTGEGRMSLGRGERKE